jgi:hypothetical protein
MVGWRKNGRKEGKVFIFVCDAENFSFAVRLS